MKLFILNNKELVFLTEVDDLKEAKKLQRKIKVTWYILQRSVLCRLTLIN